MKKEFLTSSAKFVYSKNELGYQEVLDHFDFSNHGKIIMKDEIVYVNSFLKKCKKFLRDMEKRKKEGTKKERKIRL